MEVETKQRIIVGVNQFQVEEQPPEGLLRIDASVGELQKAKLASLRAKRDNAALTQKLSALEEAAKDEQINLMPFILEAVKAYGTLGEICGVLRKVFGEYEAHISL
jgi:methylmalonyl-CoA mutase N-terminal domain/subunit